MLRVPIVKSPQGNIAYSHSLCFEPGRIGGGGNSGFQAINLAIHFGAQDIGLVGFDMQGEHWYGRNNWPMSNNPDLLCFERWIKALDQAAQELRKRGIRVVNLSKTSTLRSFQFRESGEWLSDLRSRETLSG